MHAPRPLVLGVASAGLLTLAGCGLERPTPLVTVWPGRGFSVNAEALCWSESSPPPQADCSTDRAELESVEMRANEPVVIDVDSEIEETGWLPAINGQPVVAQPLSTSSYRFTLTDAQLQGEPELQVFAVQGPGQPPQGIWAFRVERDEG